MKILILLWAVIRLLLGSLLFFYSFWRLITGQQDSPQLNLLSFRGITYWGGWWFGTTLAMFLWWKLFISGWNKLKGRKDALPWAVTSTIIGGYVILGTILELIVRLKEEVSLLFVLGKCVVMFFAGWLVKNGWDRLSRSKTDGDNLVTLEIR